jgi:hypothetical protein
LLSPADESFMLDEPFLPLPVDDVGFLPLDMLVIL